MPTIKASLRRTAVLLSLMPSVIASTATAEIITREMLHPSYDPQYVQYAASKGRFPVALIDSPVAGEALLDELALPGHFPQVPLMPVAADARQGGHLVLAFHAPISSSGRKACENPADLAGASAGNELHIQAAFCSGDEVLSEAVMTTPAPNGASDRVFKTAMARLLERVLSSRSPNDDGQCGRSNC